MKLSEAIKEAIALSNAIQNYWDIELPKHYREYPFVHPGEVDPPAPAEEKRLIDLLTGLPGEDVYKLALLMYLGRRGFGVADLNDRFLEVKDRFESKEFAISQLAGKVSLADDLAHGLEELEKHGIDADHIDVHSAHTA